MARLHAVLGTALGTLLFVGCGSSKCDVPSPCTEPAPQTFVGMVDGTDAAIGISQSAAGTTVFVCGGDDSFESFTHWFATDQILEGPSDWRDGDWSIGFSRDGQSIMGHVTSPNAAEPHTFLANIIGTDPLAGIYEGDADCGRVGLIIQREGEEEEPAAQGTCLKREDARVLIEQVNPVRPIKLSPNRGVLVELTADPERTFTLDPLAPSSAK